MSPRPDVSQERKDQILAAATKVFTERGFAEARMDDIVAESGLSKGALYWYFDSKDAIIINLLDRVFDWETANLQAILEHQDSAAHKLTAFVEVTIQDLNKIRPLMPILIDFWSLSLRKKTINQAIKRYYQRFLDILEPILQYGIDQGEFRLVNVNETALAIGAVFEGTILLWAYFSETIDIEEQFRTNLDLVLNGLVAESE